MRRRVTGMMVAVGALVALAACATTGVSSHVDPGYDFARHPTFDWGPADAFPVGDPRLDQNPIFLDYLHGAVERQLMAKGYDRAVTGRPDLVIHFHASIDRRVNVAAADAGRGYCLDDECRAGTADYEAGTLVVDVIDRRTNRLVWRGWSQKSVEGVLENRDRLVRMIEDGVARMFTTLPAAR